MKQKKFWIFRKPGCQGSNAFKNDTREKKRSILLGILMIKKEMKIKWKQNQNEKTNEKKM